MTSLDGGFVQLYTGDGKGKTTAALGLGLRARGAGLDVRLFQFMKQVESAESVALELLNIPLLRAQGDDLTTGNRELFQVALATYGNGVDVLILDEVGEAMRRGILTREDIERACAMRPANVELVMTGRGLTETIGDLADLITEMKLVKHYFDRGVLARKGIEF